MPKFQAPRGTRDLLPADMAVWRRLEDNGRRLADLYGYQPRARRERWVKERGEALSAIGRLHFYDCGHAFLPTLTKHQKFGGRPVYTVRDEHARVCAPLPQNAPPGKVGKGKGIGKVRGGMGGNENDDQLAILIGPERLERIRQKAAGG